MIAAAERIFEFLEEPEEVEDIKNPGLEFISSENDDTTPGSSLSITLE